MPITIDDIRRIFDISKEAELPEIPLDRWIRPSYGESVITQALRDALDKKTAAKRKRRKR